MHYAVQSGHRWRPLLLISAYEEIGDRDGWQVMDAACAVEVIHCCTIILDDLPFVDDNDSLRRGRLPCHVVHGQAETVYASHLLYALAERICSENALRLEANDRFMRAQINITREELVESQVLEINLMNGMTPATEASLSRLYELKSSLFVLAASLAALLGNFDPRNTKLLTRFSRSLGFAYQLLDDITDRAGISSDMGKPKYMDKDKVNLVSHLGIEDSKQFLEKMVNEAEQDLDSISANTSLLRDLLGEVVKPAHRDVCYS
jgi:geranylgeranyl pyrophosphate synthase